MVDGLNIDNYRENIHEIFIKLEQNLPIEKYIYSDFNFWSLAKTSIANKLEMSVFVTRGVPARSKSLDYTGYIAEIFKVSTPVTHMATAKLLSLNELNAHLLTADQIIYSRGSRLKLLPNQNIYQNLDFKRFKAPRRTKVLELSNNKFSYTQRPTNLKHLFIDRTEMKKKKFIKRSLLKLAHLFHMLQQSGIPAKFLPSIAELSQDVIDTMNYGSLFESALKGTNLQRAIVSTYFDVGEGTSGLVLACKRLGVEVCEYQHGLVGNAHWSHLPTAVPKRAHNLLPDKFLYWEPQLLKTFKPFVAKGPLSLERIKREPLNIKARTENRQKRRSIMIVGQYGIGNIPLNLIKFLDDRSCPIAH